MIVFCTPTEAQLRVYQRAIDMPEFKRLARRDDPCAPALILPQTYLLA
jgi:hypothetical protein